MKGKKFLLSIVTIVLAILFVFLLKTSTSLSINSKPEVDSQLQEVYRQCFIEISQQSWGTNLFYSEELEVPIFRTVSEKNWNLLNDAGILNFTSKTSGNLSLQTCYSGKITEFYYLPVDNKMLMAKTPPSEDADWIKLSISDNGNYIIPLDKIDENNIIIKYSINQVQQFYGNLTIVKY